MAARNVLIAGAGIAGPTLAWWLLKSGYEPDQLQAIDMWIKLIPSRHLVQACLPVGTQEKSAQSRSQHETQTKGRADYTHAFGAILRLSDIRHISLGHGDVGVAGSGNQPGGKKRGKGIGKSPNQITHRRSKEADK